MVILSDGHDTHKALWMSLEDLSSSQNLTDFKQAASPAKRVVSSCSIALLSLAITCLSVKYTSPKGLIIMSGLHEKENVRVDFYLLVPSKPKKSVVLAEVLYMHLPLELP